jgi:hypothetical protein
MAAASRGCGGGEVVRLSEAAVARNNERRLALANRLAELEVCAEAVAAAATDLTEHAFPAMLEALAPVLKRPEPDGELLERLIRADPERARRVLDSMTGAS